MDQVKEKATAFALSYGAAMELSLHPNADRLKTATALAEHYKQGSIPFSFGTANPMSGDIPASIESHLASFDRAGLGWRIKLVKYEIQPYSEGSAMCWLTWSIDPKAPDTPGWEWTNIYGFRLPMGEGGALAEKGIWEFTVCDHEVAELLKRRPDIFGAGQS